MKSERTSVLSALLHCMLVVKIQELAERNRCLYRCSQKSSTVCLHAHVCVYVCVCVYVRVCIDPIVTF